MSLTIAPVPMQLVEVVFDKAIPHLQKVVDLTPNEISIPTTKEKLIRGVTTMIMICDGEEVVAVNIIERVVFETGYAVLSVPIIGGERMDEWKDDFQKLAQKIARDLGCSEIRGLACRPGWIRALKSDGWYDIHSVIGRKVEPLEAEQ